MISPILLLLLTLLALSVAGFYLGRKKASAVARTAGGQHKLHSRSNYYGILTALWCCLPAFFLFLLWLIFEQRIVTALVIADLPLALQQLPQERLMLFVQDVRNLASGNIVSGEITPEMRNAATHFLELQGIGTMITSVLVVVVAIAGMLFVYRRITPGLRARNQVEIVIKSLLIVCSTIAIFTTVGIVLSVLYEAIRFFRHVPVTDFLFGLEWSPQMAIREEQVGSSGAFGAVPVFAGTLLISAIAMMVAVPVGLLSAIFLSEYAEKKIRAVVKPLLEILAGVPTVVYGFFAALVVAPAIRTVGSQMGLDVSSESALAAGLVMGIMIIPFVSSLSDDVINAVPQSLRDGAYSVGATRSETIKHVLIPAALPGIVGGILLAVSRAIGETMIVVMAAGLSANLTANPLQAVTTVTVQIVTLLVGDQEFDSPKTLAAFALGLVLFIGTLLLNIVALTVVRKYRERYE
ncbi:phosphate ABC transporter permease subunit PstC [Prosthecochloris marina]|uniref:Phosphate transport system permease protein n=1 Tax=Prosthecochloris marina TaxID=2017681 RepID=A0A317T930_9CHLB|nr:phosphate ABC transporter permease subunit PstC [Prosthecochloris marina]PWW81931.1 phosphate ABC transporter permease subunit PstC [Prosthecochloris marina]